jgi:hypothetical protein
MLQAAAVVVVEGGTGDVEDHRGMGNGFGHSVSTTTKAVA